MQETTDLVVIPFVCLLLVEHSLAAWTLGFTRRRSVRLLSMVAIGCLIERVQRALTKVVLNKIWKAIAVSLLWMHVLKMLDELLISHCTFEEFRKSKKTSKDSATASGSEINREQANSDSTPGSRLNFGVGMLWNQRGVATPWAIDEVKNSEPMSKKAFILRHGMSVLLSFLTIDLLSTQPLEDLALVQPQKQHLLSQISETTAEELVFRAASTFAFWLNIYALISLTYSGVALSSVFLRLSSHQDWPPIFGSPTEGFTIRRFWGIFWHQTLRRLLTDTSRFTVIRVFRMPPQTKSSWYARLVVSFLLSGLMHSIADMEIGLPGTESGSLTFFLAQAGGIIFEDGVQGYNNRTGIFRDQRLSRTLGYLWVAFFLVWWTPQWSYPSFRAAGPDDDLFSFSLLRPMIMRGSSQQQD